ncbi:MAG: hypothetical protein OEL53_09745 [Rhodospirillales bacterium]|nr:hypothetical protein [Rhodospirillales bacterium]
MTLPPNVRRIAVTRPPAVWGRDLQAAKLAWSVMEGLGLELFELDIDLLLNGSAQEIGAHISDLLAFRPQLAVATPNAGYLFNAVISSAKSRPNVFLDVLAIPCLLTWDSVVQFPSQLPHINRSCCPDETSRGVLQSLKSALDHPLLFHVAYDKGQIDAMVGLGILPAGRVLHKPVFAYQAFVDFGRAEAASVRQDERVAFTGTLRVDALPSPYESLAFFPELDRQVVSDRPLAQPVWNSLIEFIAGLPAQERETFGLGPDSGCFWGLADYIVSYRANILDRLRVIEGIARPVTFYGNVVEKGVSAFRLPPNMTMGGDQDMISRLPKLNAGTAITVDVVNRIFGCGYTAKIASCLAAGGFCLFDWRPEFIDAFGDDGGQLMFRSIDELNEKIDIFLGNSVYRRALADYFKNEIAQHHSAKSFYTSLLSQMAVNYKIT